MKIPFSETSLVRDIVNELPKSSDLFKKYRIDFCCGGNIPLLEAASEKSISIDELMKQLEELYISNENSKEDIEVWTNSKSDVIIEHIKNHYHRSLEEELANLSPYVTKVSKVHGDRHPELLKVHELFYELKKELLEHTAKEEASVFPMLLKLDEQNVENREEIINEIIELEKEHDHAGNILRELREITSDYLLPFDACGTYRLVYSRLEGLESHTFDHVHLENNILFPRYIGK
ncbi:iron-sulfur cluster repair di-iron protein [Bacillus massilinigeriensis]|uniref:iron-sulfur cluster repair di-iron protein n=1 Tax=Bacillus massilionigeriensis TaxID=1805475 RepID=UPI00096AE813|nr:iron-sulfur cluster repair di-iron protein [Bacillus massilionigeriensis]